jgi:hypothetical protein
MNTAQHPDRYAQLRALYNALLNEHERFDVFRRMLALYDVPEDADVEPAEATAVREELNARIRSWLGEFDGMGPQEILLWRRIVIEDRFNVTLSPWKESNGW